MNLDLLKEFREKFSLDYIKKMTLEDYTSTGGDERDDFTYWLEHKLYGLSVGGGNAEKFIIYKCSDKNEQNNDRMHYDDGYAWLKNKNIGSTKDEAFKKVRDAIIEIIEASQNNNLEKIDSDISIFSGNTIKWAIAFCYQKDIENNLTIINIFKKEVLKKIAKYELEDENLSIPEIYKEIIKKHNINIKNLEEESKYLWDTYEDKSQNKSDEANEDKKNKPSEIPLNQILYGPPGTGKTYNTINKALEILTDDKYKESFLEIKKKILKKHLHEKTL